MADGDVFLTFTLPVAPPTVAFYPGVAPALSADFPSPVATPAPTGTTGS